MRNKPILMIHAVDERLFELPLSDYILTFDDGLYSQFKYIDRLVAIDTEKIFYISTNILCTGQQSTEHISSEAAHRKVFQFGNNENFMTLEQVKHLATLPQVYIGGHSHFHNDLRRIGIVERVTRMRKDTEEMIAWFDTNLGFRPTKFCFPYNYNSDGLYDALLKQYGISKFHGRERIPVETLLRKLPQLECLSA
jgi:hypothetical protein